MSSRRLNVPLYTVEPHSATARALLQAWGTDPGESPDIVSEGDVVPSPSPSP